MGSVSFFLLSFSRVVLGIRVNRVKNVFFVKKSCLGLEVKGYY